MCKMSRSHFQFIADVLRHCKMNKFFDSESRHIVDMITQEFGRELSATNPRFQEEKFLTAAGFNLDNKE